MEPQQRKGRRFTVSHLEKLKGRIKHGPDHLTTFGDDGCGFYSQTRFIGLTVGVRAFCTFEFDGVLGAPLEVQGNIVFVREVDLNGTKIFYYGIEFLPAHKPLVAPILMALDQTLTKS